MAPRSRVPVLVVLVLLVTALLQTSTSAATRGESSPPTVEVIDVEEIVAAGAPAIRVTLEAVDPDGIISEIDAYWGDHSIDFAHGYPCLLGLPPAPGTPHRMILTHTYPEPGTYLPEFEALSLSGCDAPPDEPYEVSEHTTLEVVWTHGGATTTTTTTTADPDGGGGTTTTTAPTTTVAPDDAPTTTTPAAPPAPAVRGNPAFTG